MLFAISSYTDFVIGGIVAGTILVTILRDCYFHCDTDKYPAPSEHIHYNRQIRTSSVWRFLWEMTFFVLRFESVVSYQLLHSDGFQPRFSSLSPASLGSCGHRRRAHQIESRNEAMASVSGESVQSQPGE